ncbi:MAG: hypothetical protein CR989_02010 [Flavobacteriales bacterium]|nr:MAG: hypothetical protein CR989_02010 [Flavobacteriales bacterium]
MNKLFYILLLIICFSGYAQVINPEVEATIKVVENEGMISIEGIAENKTNIYQQELLYLLVGLKTGTTGNISKNQQSGKFSLDPEESKVLTTLKVNRQPAEQIKLYLFIRKGEQLIDKDTLVLGNVQKSTKIRNTDSGIEIKGLVVEEVITKPAKDFYDYFYQKYSNSSRQFPYVVKITEKPLPGISSLVTVYADDDAIYVTRTNPRQEFLESSAQEAILALNNYYQRQQLLFKNEFKY